MKKSLAKNTCGNFFSERLEGEREFKIVVNKINHDNITSAFNFVSKAMAALPPPFEIVIRKGE